MSASRRLPPGIASRCRATDDDDAEMFDQIARLRRRLRGEHHATTQGEQPLAGHAPPAPPKLMQDAGYMSELSVLRRVWQRLDIDQDGILSPDDLYRSMKKYSLKSVSKQEAFDILWEVALSPDPQLTFKGFTGAYARAKENFKDHPLRFYNYIVYTIMDLDQNGVISADEVYQHFYAYSADPKVVKGTSWLLDCITHGAVGDEVTPGLFIRSMQSGALQNMGSKKAAVSKRRASSSSSIARKHMERPHSASSASNLASTASPSIRSLDTTKAIRALNCSVELNTLDLRRERFCSATGITNVWAKQGSDSRSGRRTQPLSIGCNEKNILSCNLSSIPSCRSSPSLEPSERMSPQWQSVA